jgi:hypothetical protein
MQATILTRLWTLTLLVIVAATSPAAAQTWGRLANPGFTNRRIKATLFFAGQARDGTEKYQPYCGLLNDEPNRSLYPPLGSPHLKWTENETNRHLALNLMVQAGINVINMSSWGEKFPPPNPNTPPPCLWDGAPMQTSPESHDELFIAAKDKPLLIVPFIESRGGGTPWAFRDEFPTTLDRRIAPGTISQIVNLVERYLKNPANPDWAEKWARVYDQNGEERYAVAIIHASSDQLGLFPTGPFDDHIAFAEGFDLIAEAVYQQTGGAQNRGVKVGFFIDALPSGTHAPGVFKPSPEETGPFLRATRSLLGIECFVPEVFLGLSNTTAVISWKRSFSQRWFQTGIPFLMDVSSGYDGRRVPQFGTNSAHYGLTTEWLAQLAQMTEDYGRAGMVFNSWNGYSEAMAAVPGVTYRLPDGTTQFYGNLFYDWLSTLHYVDVYARKPDAPAPRDGTLARPYTLAEAIQNVPVDGTVGLLPTTSEPFGAPVTINKACTMISIGGSARIGP